MENMTRKVEQMARKNAKRRFWQRFVAIPAAIVVFVTTYALILPAIAMERDTYCGQEAHTHSDECYTAQLACGYEDGAVVESTQTVTALTCTASAHQHTEECFDEDGSVICGFADYLVHTHTAECYNALGELVCPLPEVEAHTHDESCYAEELVNVCGMAEGEGHTHTEACYTVVSHPEMICGQAESAGHWHDENCYTPVENTYLVCGQEESAGHIHGESCYTTTVLEDGTEVTELTCGLEESVGHVHTDACYATETTLELTCGLAETAGHTHTEACFVNVEELELTCGLPESPAHTHTDACFVTEKRLVCTKPEVILHTHNEDCYTTTVLEDGTEVTELTCDQTVVEEHVHSAECFTTYEEMVERTHHHTDLCYIHTLTCTLPEHVHTKSCYEKPEEPEVTPEPEIIIDPGMMVQPEIEAPEATEEPVEEPEASAEPTDGETVEEPEASAEPEIVELVDDMMPGLPVEIIGEDEITEPEPSEEPIDGETAEEPETTEEPELICELAEHTHNEDCYIVTVAEDGTETTELICEIPEHTHDESCYAAVIDDEPVTIPVEDLVEIPTEELEIVEDATPYFGMPVLVCGMEEHEHSTNCMDENMEFACGIEPHTHTGACYDIPGLGVSPILTCALHEHTHGEACYDAEGNLVCALAEHTHTGTCFTLPEAPAQRRVLTCKMEAHEHNEYCFDENMKLICGKVAHTHYEDECYEMVDVTELVITCGMIEHMHGIACYDENGELVCQLPEHVHADSCFSLPEDENDEPVLVLYCGKHQHTHTELCYNEAGELTCGMEEHTHTDACYINAGGLDTVCGMVEHKHTVDCYDVDGNVICGLAEHTHTAACYGIETETVLTFTLPDGSGVAVSGPSSFFPQPVNAEALTLSVREVLAGSGDYEFASALLAAETGAAQAEGEEMAEEAEPEIGFHRLFDICIMDGDTAVQPLGRVTVTFKNMVEAGAEDMNVYHVNLNDGAVEDMLATAGEDGNVVMTTTHFSYYDVMTAAAGENQLRGGGLKAPEAEQAPEIPAEVTAEPVVTEAPAEVTAEPVVTAEPEVQGDEGESQQDPENADDPDQTPVLQINMGGVPLPSTENSNGVYSLMGTKSTKTTWVDIQTAYNNGSSIKLLSNVTAGSAISINKKFTIDLNGHTISGTSGGNRLFNVGAGGNLIIQDHGQWSAPTEGTGSFTYTVTTSVPVGDTGTREQKITKTVDLSAPYTGKIENSGRTVRVSSGGTFTLDGGTLHGIGWAPLEIENGTVTINGGHIINTDITQSGGEGGGGGAIYVWGPSNDAEKTINLYKGVIRGCTGEEGGAIRADGLTTINIRNGFYLVENKATAEGEKKDNYPVVSDKAGNGGAIYVASDCTVNIEGGVIAKNTARERGGGIYGNGANINISGGYIAENTAQGSGLAHDKGGIAFGGGGIYIGGLRKLLTISGGYITNNQSTGALWSPPYGGYASQGGGGVMADDGASIEMTGGYVTGNYAASSAGGIFLRTGSTLSSFTMSGGFISSNVANLHEGGGLYIDCFGQTGKIQVTGSNKVYITNNRSNTTADWGGGGIFVGGYSSLTIYDALITANTACGFGGGVAGCPTGRIYLNEDNGAATYDNIIDHSDGIHLSNGGKSADHTAVNDPDFMDGGYRDFFSCLTSQVDHAMLGSNTTTRYSANWSGSADSNPFDYRNDNKTEGSIQASNLMGLVAHPSDEAIQAAIEAAGVIITGNRSNTHGGGIMTNGVLDFGGKHRDLVSIGAEAMADKKLVDAKTNNTLNMSKGQFSFEVLEDTNKDGILDDGDTVVNEAQVSSSGSIDGIRFPGIDVDKEKSLKKKTFFLRERIPVETDGAIEYDENTVYKFEFTISQTNGETYGGVQVNTIVTYYYSDVTITKSTNGGKTFPTTLSKVTQKYGDEHYLDADYYLYVNGEARMITKIVFNPKWTHTDRGWEVHGTKGSNPAFTNKQKELTGSLNLLKLKRDDNETEDKDLKKLDGVTFRLSKFDATTGTVGAPVEDKTTGAEGLITFSNLKEGWYFLEEMPGTTNADYQKEGPWLVEVTDDGKATDPADTKMRVLLVTVYKATQNSDGSWTQGDGVSLETYEISAGGTIGDGHSVNKVKAFVLKVTNEKIRDMYELPETGGSGTMIFTLSGAALLALAGAGLAYRRRKQHL